MHMTYFGETTMKRRSPVTGSIDPRWARALIPALGALLAAFPAHASLFSGDTLDLVADIMAWVVLVIAPAVAIAVFWMVHILPEKIAEQRHHPQASAIKTLCLLSLFFGGLLWPLAWLWAYSKPVLYKMAYGTDVVDPHAPHAGSQAPEGSSEGPEPPILSPSGDEEYTPVHDRRRGV
jgi:cytochrome bd-type quinol oxidase subunit 2